MNQLSRLDLTSLLFMIVLGASGVYLLLPHAHGRVRPKLAHQFGYAFSILAIIRLMWFCQTTADVELVTKGFFYLFGFGAVGCSILTITSRDPIHSALWFAAVVLATSGLFLLSGAQFLAAGTVIVYAGAIIVTFLFVIMLAQKEGRAIYDRMARAPFLATLSSFLLLFGLVFSLLSIRVFPPEKHVEGQPLPAAPVARLVPAAERLALKPGAPETIVLNRALPTSSLLPETKRTGPTVPHVAGLGATLYTEHLATVELAGALLFAALIGALAIAAPKPPTRPTPKTPTT